MGRAILKPGAKWVLALVSGATLLVTLGGLPCQWRAATLMRAALHAQPPPTFPACADHPPVLRATGVAWLRAGQLGEARRSLEAASQRVPDHAQTYHWLAHLFTTTGDREGTIRALDSAGEIRPLRRLAEEALMGGREAEARLALEAILRGAPNDGWTMLHFARIALADGDLAASEGWLERVRAVEPNNLWLWVTLGSLREAQGRWDEAEAAYRQATALGTGEGVPALSLGRLALTRQQWDEAEAWLHTAQRQRPNDANIPTLLAQVAAGREATSGGVSPSP